MLLLLAVAGTSTRARDIVLVTFDGAVATTHTWRQMNDPVMGGRSSGTFSVQGGLGILDGEVVNVPFLKAPGFIKAQTSEGAPWSKEFDDISSCKAIAITCKASSRYSGYRFTMGKTHAPEGKFFAYGYKSHFTPPVGHFDTVTIMLDDFTDYWDDATGEPIKTCKEDKIYCPDTKTLKDMRTMSLWAEGVAGKVHLEVQQISATGCDDDKADLYA